jgi:hypothetical protein
MKKFISLLAVLCVILCFGFIAGCNDDDDDDEPGNELIGSWIGNFEEDDCFEIQELSFLDNGTYTVHTNETCEGENPTTDVDKGNWEVEDDCLYLTLTETTASDERDQIGVKQKIYYFITSTDQLALEEEINIWTRTGNGTGIVGEWEFPIDGDGCQETLTFNANGTLSWMNDCPDDDEDEAISGTYTTNGDVLIGTHTENGELITEKSFFKIIDSKLVQLAEGDVYSKD